MLHIAVATPCCLIQLLRYAWAECSQYGGLYTCLKGEFAYMRITPASNTHIIFWPSQIHDTFQPIWSSILGKYQINAFLPHKSVEDLCDNNHVASPKSNINCIHTQTKALDPLCSQNVATADQFSCCQILNP